MLVQPRVQAVFPLREKEASFLVELKKNNGGGGGGEIKHSQPGIHQSQKLNEILKNSSFRCSRNILNHLEKAGCSITCCGSLSTLLAAGCLHLLGRPLKRQRERPEHSPCRGARPQRRAVAGLSNHCSHGIH